MKAIHRNSLVLLAILASLAVTPIRADSVRAGTPNTWTTVAPLKTGLLWPAAASANGKLYVFGGLGCNGKFCQPFEAYNPRTNRWMSMGDMPESLIGLPSATTGPDGLIYYFGLQQGGGGGAMLVYHPKTNSWSRVPSPPGIDEAAILVTGRDGLIYAVGGDMNGGSAPAGTLSAFNVMTRHWTRLAPNRMLTSQPAAAIGSDGRIFAIESDQTSSHVQAYDPKTNTWTSIAAAPTPRFASQAVTGPDGRIYVLGGEGRCFTAPCNEVQAFDVHTGKWTRVATMPHGRWSFAAAAGPDGRIYALGGFTTANQTMPGSSFPKSVDAYTVVPGDQPLPASPPAPAIATKKLAPMPTGRDDLGATTAGGKIYAIGGEQPTMPYRGPPQPPKVLTTVEAYDPSTNAWATEPSLPAPRMDMGVTTGPDGRIYVLGGVATPLMTSTDSNNGVPGKRSVEIFDPSTDTWSKGKPMPDGRYAFTAVTGKDGLIYTIGGATDCSFGSFRKTQRMTRVRPARDPAEPGFPGGQCEGMQTVRSFDPLTDTWKTLAPLHVGRIFPAAAVGADGRIYVFGGDDSDSLPSRRFEVYNPATNRWTLLGGMPHIRSSGFAAAMDRSGHIDLIGGCLIGSFTKTGFSEYCGDPDPVDSYDPQANRWTKLGVALDTRTGLAAATGPDGQVYVVGGQSYGYGNGRLLEVIRQGSVGGRRDR